MLNLRTQHLDKLQLLYTFTWVHHYSFLFGCVFIFEYIFFIYFILFHIFMDQIFPNFNVFLHVWTLFNKLETIAVQQEILVSLVDMYASFQQENPGATLVQESARIYQLSRSRPCLKEKIPP
jgi:hypothetical protein